MIRNYEYATILRCGPCGLNARQCASPIVAVASAELHGPGPGPMRNGPRSMMAMAMGNRGKGGK